MEVSKSVHIDHKIISHEKLKENTVVFCLVGRKAVDVCDLEINMVLVAFVPESRLAGRL